jgi:hypothetical protein
MTILNFIGYYLLADAVASILVLALFVSVRKRALAGLQVLAHRLVYPIARQAAKDEIESQEQEPTEVCADCFGEDCICEDKNA